MRRVTVGGPRLRWPGVAPAGLFLVVCIAACGEDPAGPGNDGVSEEQGVAMCTPLAAGDAWTFARLGAGAKPALAVEGDGTVHAAFMSEDFEGWVRYAELPAGASSVPARETVDEGYFYGPIDILLGPDGRPRVLFHDHDLEDQVLAVRSTGDWSLERMSNTGHDGWYNSGVFGSDGTLHTATYDPAGFAGKGVIYGAWDGAAWGIEVAAAGSFDYAGGTAIVSGVGGIQVAFFDDVARVVKIASRSGADQWSVTTVEERAGRNEVGRFPDMVLDSDGSTLHLVYLSRNGSTLGGDVIRYARGTPGSFEFDDIAPVSDFTIGFSGARDIATLGLDSSGTPVVAIQDRSELRILRVGATGVETVAAFRAAQGIAFMQQTEVAIDDQGRIHVVWWQSGEAPGTVCHAVNG